ncbi:MAG: SufE family protein [Geminicoccaceae bacterium]
MASTATVAEAADELREEFALFDEWRDKIEHIVELGKALPPLPEEHKIPANKVSGCQSQVWLIAPADPATGRLALRADSDAIIVKGLIAILLRLYADRLPDEILANPPTVLEEIGLGQHLTPGRSNGLWSMNKRIRELAAEARAVSAAAG